MFLDFLLSQNLDIRRTIFQGLDRHRTFLSMKFSTNSEDFNFDKFLFWWTHHQTSRCTRQICWWTVISTNLWKIFSRNSKDLNLDVSRTGRTRWLTGRFRWTRQISWWIYSSHALFDRFSVLIIGAFFSKVRGYPFKSAPPTLRECNIMSYCTNIITVAFSPYFKTQLELWFPRTD